MTFLGFADDNYVDGTQSFVFNFVSPGIVDTPAYAGMAADVRLTKPRSGLSAQMKICVGSAVDASKAVTQVRSYSRNSGLTVDDSDTKASGISSRINSSTRRS
mgnify:CR=1 FL=1